MSRTGAGARPSTRANTRAVPHNDDDISWAVATVRHLVHTYQAGRVAPAVRRSEQQEQHPGSVETAVSGRFLRAVS